MSPRVAGPLFPGLVLVAGLFLGLTPTVQAQVRRGPPPGRAQMEREVQMRFQERVRQELGLTETQAQELAGVVAAFQAERRALVQREMRLRQQLQGTGPLLSDEAARATLDEMAAVQAEEADLLRREQARLLRFLSPPQAVRFYTLRAELGERIRRLQGGGGGGAPPGTLAPGWGFD